ncbi:MAG: 1-deoxy-D-xylulose-5-phosphate synthase [Oscillospiraceae bacterium]|nr:1-deoxy-D-xylulose-5-phosphate synthase [Oscillospiraceae bacterium]
MATESRRYNVRDETMNINVNEQNIGELKELASEIREFLISNVPENGGHFASNLGVVELTLALHKVFETPSDSIIFDVGHQSYTHKILTERKDILLNKRANGGISGFPRLDESEHDAFGVGHSSTSISAALGIARAKKLQGDNTHTIAVIGDGALTGGLAFEALNNLKSCDNNLIIVLNDNGMSINKNVGAYSRYLTKFRTNPVYLSFKRGIDFSLNRIPLIGAGLARFAFRFKDVFRSMLMPTTIFEKMGISYIGPVDGHNLNELISAMERVKKYNYPVLIHALTVKGKGFTEAEEEPTSYHAVYPKAESSLVNTSVLLGDMLCDEAIRNDKVVVIDSAMSKGLGLTEFAKKFPERFFDVGIAEGHAVTFAAGMAAKGMRPIVPIYSSFAQRAYDQMLHDVALQNLPVTFMIASCGLDKCGETHHGIFDLSYTSNMPNLTVLAPSSAEQMAQMFEYSMGLNSPCVIRFPKELQAKTVPFVPNESRIVQCGTDLTIFSIGDMLEVAKETAKLLPDYSAEIIDVGSIRPLDMETIKTSLEKTKLAITIENGIKQNGAGALISSRFPEFPIYNFGYDANWFPGFDTMESYGLTADLLASFVKEKHKIEVKKYA